MLVLCLDNPVPHWGLLVPDGSTDASAGFAEPCDRPGTWNSCCSFLSIHSVTWRNVTSRSPSFGRTFSSSCGGTRKLYLCGEREEAESITTWLWYSPWGPTAGLQGPASWEEVLGCSGSSESPHPRWRLGLMRVRSVRPFGCLLAPWMNPKALGPWVSHGELGGGRVHVPAWEVRGAGTRHGPSVAVGCSQPRFPPAPAPPPSAAAVCWKPPRSSSWWTRFRWPFGSTWTWRSYPRSAGSSGSCCCRWRGCSETQTRAGFQHPSAITHSTHRDRSPQGRAGTMCLCVPCREPSPEPLCWSSPMPPMAQTPFTPYPSVPGSGTRSPRTPMGSAAATSSSSEDPALDDSASLSASRISRGLALRAPSSITGCPGPSTLSPQQASGGWTPAMHGLLTPLLLPLLGRSPLQRSPSPACRGSSLSPVSSAMSRCRWPPCPPRALPGEGWGEPLSALQGLSLPKPPCFRDKAGTSITPAMEPGQRPCGALTSVIHGGAGGAEDRGDGCAHVQLCQCQLVHEIGELMEGNHTGMVTTAWHLLQSLKDGASAGAAMLLPLTLILLSFFWILLDTCSAQYRSRRKSQKMRPTSAFIQAMQGSLCPAASSPSCGGTGVTSSWSGVAPWAWGPHWLGAPQHHGSAGRWATGLEVAAHRIRQPLPVSRSQCGTHPTHLCGAAQCSMREALLRAAPGLRWHESGHVGAVIQENLLLDAPSQLLGRESGGDVLRAPPAAATAALWSWAHACGHGDTRGDILAMIHIGCAMMPVWWCAAWPWCWWHATHPMLLRGVL